MVSGAMLRLYVSHPADELKNIGEMSFAQQLHYAYKYQRMKTGIETNNQDGALDPFQDVSQDPWKKGGASGEARGVQYVLAPSVATR